VYADDCGECGNCGECGSGRVARGNCGECGNCGARGGCGECCDDGCCCQRNFCFHPLRWIGRLFYCGTWCGPSCGNTYWGEAVSDPPDCCDPCSRDGHWTGRRGCAQCNHGGMQESDDMTPLPDGAALQDDPGMQPTLAPPATKATRRAPDYKYDR
jgi:hypothetical protein